jgi:hypothetical protein
LNTLNLNVHKNAIQEAQNLESGSTERAYRELRGLRHETKDVLKQLEANILLLEDLGGRLSFVLSEVRSLIRR